MKITLNFDDNLFPDDKLSSKYKADLMNTLWVVAKTAAKDHFKGAEVDDKTLLQLANNEWGEWSKTDWK
jgi:hypothetical protein